MPQDEMIWLPFQFLFALTSLIWKKNLCLPVSFFHNGLVFIYPMNVHTYCTRTHTAHTHTHTPFISFSFNFCHQISRVFHLHCFSSSTSKSPFNPLHYSFLLTQYHHHMTETVLINVTNVLHISRYNRHF